MTRPPRVVAITGADGVLGSRVAALLADRELRLVDRRRGHELAQAATYAHLLDGCDAVVHTAALHPLVAPAGVTAATYREANVAPFEVLVELMRRRAVARLVLASSTSVWREADPGSPARFLDEQVDPDAADGYAESKLRCESLARHSVPEPAALRLARFAKRGDPEDDVRLLYRAVDPDDAAAAVVHALDRASTPALYAISAPTPFKPEDAADLVADPIGVIRRRTGREPAWAPRSIGSVVIARKAMADLGWRPAHPSSLFALVENS